MKTLFICTKKRVCATALLFVFLSVLFPMGTIAQVMQSSSYKIQSDSINIGGAPSTSSSYGLNDTLGEVGTGDSNSASYYMHAGYWQMQDSYIALSAPSDLNLASMGGVSGGSSEGTTSWTVTTDNPAGYTMTINASTSPALTSGGNSFADYVPSTADPDYTFTNAASDSSFGFSPEGTEVVTRFKDNTTSACNTGSAETSGKCWDGLSTTPKTIAGSATSNHTAGSTVTVRFRAESGASHLQPAGTYNATVTITATTL
jgi:hypothetical protein